jgi:PIN domain nuclease of toxin-antitoxin system
MRIILDTHIFLWALAEPQKIDAAKRVEIELLSNIIYVSAVSIAEIMIKASLGKLRIDFDPVEAAESTGFELLDFTARDAVLLKDLPFYHKDPFDRMLITQSISNKYPILTDDEKFKPYGCKLI